MKPRTLQSTCRGKLSLAVIAIFFFGLLTPVHSQTPAQQAQSQEMTTTTSDAADTEQAPKLPNDQLDSLVAPIALYPDPLLAQTLAASTYPLEVIQLEQWMGRTEVERQSAGGRSGKAAVGPKRPGNGRVSRRGTAYGGQYPVDDGFGKRIPGARIGRDGRSSAHARERLRAQEI